MKLGELIKAYRAEHGNMSQRTFAANCGLSNSYIHMLEAGSNPKTQRPIVPTLDAFKALAKGMGTSVDDIFSKIEDSPIDLGAVETVELVNGDPKLTALLDKYRENPKARMMFDVTATATDAELQELADYFDFIRRRGRDD